MMDIMTKIYVDSMYDKDIDFFIDCFQVATARYSIALEEDPRWPEINDLARSVVPDYKEII